MYPIETQAQEGWLCSICEEPYTEEEEAADCCQDAAAILQAMDLNDERRCRDE
jgi:hypothetical protein